MIEQSVVVEFAQDERDQLGLAAEEIFDHSVRLGIERLLAGGRIPLAEARGFSQRVNNLRRELEDQIEALELIERRIEPELLRADRELHAYEAAMMRAAAGMFVAGQQNVRGDAVL